MPGKAIKGSRISGDKGINQTMIFSFNAFRKLYVPAHLQVVFGDLFNIHSEIREDDNINHLQSAMDWLNYAQDVTQDGGISAGYSFGGGWLPSYPETTGYIIPTFLNYYHFASEEEYLRRAIKMADWLVSIQLENGAFQGGFISAPPRPIVFNTGQALQGLIRIYKETQQNRYLKAALRAANWLKEVQDEDGSWRRFTFNGIAHVYHTRVAWPLLEIYELTSDETYMSAATKNIEWALSNQEANGWFRNNAFGSKSDPFLHTIAYAIRGLLECAGLTGNKSWLKAVIKPSEVLLRRFEIKGSLSGIYNDKWKGTVGYRCLTGEAQMSVCCLRVFQLTSDARFLNVALKMNDSLKRLQDTSSSKRGINGGIKGSHPIWGGYMPFMYPNWAVKFFADALILGERLRK